VTKFRSALEEADIEHEVISYYNAGHAFWKDVGQVPHRLRFLHLASPDGYDLIRTDPSPVLSCAGLSPRSSHLIPSHRIPSQVEREEMPVIAGYRLTTAFLSGFFSGKESFAKKRAFLEFQLRESAEGQIGPDAVAEDEDSGA
jgi:hypothetical protein